MLGKELDARNYGVPQRRRRVFILGVLPGAAGDNFAWPPPPTHGRDGSNDLLPWRGCSAAFLPASADDQNDLHMKHSADLVAAFARTPANGGSRHQSGRLLNCHRDHDGHNDVYGRIDPARPAPTMTTACINVSRNLTACWWLRPNPPEWRCLSRECGRSRDDLACPGGR